MEIKKSKLSRKNRKKYHVGEFQQFGFTILIKMKECSYESKEDVEFIDDLYDKIIDVIEAEKLQCSGGGGKNHIMFAITDQGIKNTLNQEKVDSVLKQIKAIDSVIDAVTFPLVDAWNFDDADDARESALIKAEKARLGIKD